MQFSSLGLALLGLFLAGLAAKYYSGLPLFLPTQHSAGQQCDTPKYIVRFLSYDPVLVHIENFITHKERRHLLELSTPLLQRSTTQSDNGSTTTSDYRTSFSALLPRNDSIAGCIAQRVAEFQGYTSVDAVEDLQVTSYTSGQEFKAHYDWASVDRISTFFGILEAQCDNCGTQFTQLAVDWAQEDLRWCDLVDCDDHSALTIKPVPGNVLFWRNLDNNGTGDRRTLHAGLPVTDGFKIGLNIWTGR